MHFTPTTVMEVVFVEKKESDCLPVAQNPTEMPARQPVQGSSHQASIWGQPFRWL